MKSRSLLVLAAVLITTAAHAKPTILPDACGNDKTEFDVKKIKGNPPITADPTKAQIVFIQLVPAGGLINRLGIDGTWVGAVKGTSYFSVFVAPGVHHICAAHQSKLGYGSLSPGVTAITAEAGKTYYYEYQVTMTTTGGGQRMVAGPNGTQQTYQTGITQVGGGFLAVDEDEGKYRVKSCDQVGSKPEASEN